MEDYVEEMLHDLLEQSDSGGTVDYEVLSHGRYVGRRAHQTIAGNSYVPAGNLTWGDYHGHQKIVRDTPWKVLYSRRKPFPLSC
jgi:hypothetical protein